MKDSQITKMLSTISLLPATLLIMMLSCVDTTAPGEYGKYQFRDCTELPLNVSLEQGKTNVFSMNVLWYAVPYNNETTKVLNYQVQYTLGERMLQTGFLSPRTNQFYIMGLETSSSYDVCLTMWYTEDEQHYTTKLCKVMTTIAMIRSDSVYAVCFTLIIVGLVILSAYLYWRYRKFQFDRKKALVENEHEQHETDDEHDVGATGNNVHANQNQKSLSQRLSKRYSGYEQGASIEDHETRT